MGKNGSLAGIEQRAIFKASNRGFDNCHRLCATFPDFVRCKKGIRQSLLVFLLSFRAQTFLDAGPSVDDNDGLFVVCSPGKTCGEKENENENANGVRFDEALG
jgi:hypothetical protein